MHHVYWLGKIKWLVGGSTCKETYFLPADLLLAKHVYSTVNKLAMSEQGVRLPNNHALFNQLLSILTTNFGNMKTTQWIPLCEQGLKVVYQLSEQPNLFAEALLSDLSQQFNLKGIAIYFISNIIKESIIDGVSSVVLSRLLFCAGHVAQCQVLHCEVHIVQERKRMRPENQSKVSGTKRNVLLCQPFHSRVNWRRNLV